VEHPPGVLWQQPPAEERGIQWVAGRPWYATALPPGLSRASIVADGFSLLNSSAQTFTLSDISARRAPLPLRPQTPEQTVEAPILTQGEMRRACQPERCRFPPTGSGTPAKNAETLRSPNGRQAGGITKERHSESPPARNGAGVSGGLSRIALASESPVAYYPLLSQFLQPRRH
jgi:hypothetical protein